MNLPPPNSQTHDLTDQKIGDYHVIRRLGRGGMADVYLAEQLSLKRNVALKILKPELAVDKSYVERFHREAQAAAALVQANIVQIYEVGEENGIHFIAQEYVAGRNLRQYLARHGAVEPLMALNILRQVAQALQRADEIGVVHRDIKPENIMLSTSGEIKVTDFGLARLLTEDKDNELGLTKVGITMGTPLYMSPEQAEGKHLDTRSDIYSLGATAYHMLAGQPPFDGENALAIAVKHVNTEAPSLVDIRPDSPETLNLLVHRMMAKKPDDRPANAGALLKELRKVRISDDESWETLVDKIADYDTDENIPTVDSKLAATRQLQSVMRGHLDTWWTSRWIWPVVTLLLVFGLAAGVIAAVFNPPPYLLEGVQTRAISDSVPRQDTVIQQYRMAYWVVGNSEKYWQAVVEYFPPEKAASEDKNETLYYNRMANERLGEIYLEQKDLTKATEIYEQFANTEDLSERINVVGWAGQAVIYDINQQTNNCVAMLDKVQPHVDLLSEYLKVRIIELIQKYNQPSISF